MNRSGNEILPVLNENADNRKLNLNVVENDWNPNYRWLAVRTSLL